MQAFAMIKNIGMMINVDANVKNWLIKVYATKDCQYECDKLCDVGDDLDY